MNSANLDGNPLNADKPHILASPQSPDQKGGNQFIIDNYTNIYINEVKSDQIK